MNEKQQDILNKVVGLTVEKIELLDEEDTLYIYFESGVRLRLEGIPDPIDMFKTHTDIYLEEQRGFYGHYHEVDTYDSLQEQLELDLDIPDEEKEF